MGQQSLIYSFVARGTVILAEYTEVTGNFTSIASQCLQKLPASNNKFTYNCDNHTFNYLVEDGYTYCVVAVESVGRQIPVAFLERIKEDFTKRYGGGKAATAVANSLNREFGPKLKEHMQYCVDHPEEINKLAKVKAQVSEVKRVMMENIEKVLDRGEKIELLVYKTENLRSQVFSSEHENTTQEISVVRKVMEESAPGEGEADKVSEVAPALISVHPLDNSVVVAVGSELRIFDLKGNSVISLSEDVNGPPHFDAIRGICFSANGRLFASGGDDKLVKIWRTDTWHCIRTVYSEKRVSAVAISHDGLFVTFADKFGVVWLEGLQEGGQNQGLIGRKAVPLLGHYCSVITNLKFSPDRKFIASADRDFKIRITIFPQRPTKGAHEIQSFCLGHTDFVSCLAFICPPGFPQSLLLSGSGDATVYTIYF
ncbi:Vesicle-associated membrane protein 725 [Apostasia shenzhenica]|uniref:Vesicle-associated membrane protein 725 n=1 Tax=Apostasia shenzhenica TaxID=1088818 RepID=A0A2I0B0S0_9ASPA|nr:Vesicle-associated membrane protein 725 [Apostasia shenzhenica]